MQATIFDIQRGSLNDGPGIRTTVFFKGCPLRCVWCHNPESIDARIQFGRADGDCSCDGCWEFGERARSSGGPVYAASADERLECEQGLIRRYGENRSLDDVFGIVVRDRAFYETSGGGLTLSGGEPLLQAAFVKELSRRAREQSIHVCLDTSGHVRPELFAEVAREVDMVLLDYKASDDDAHRGLTGVSRALIAQNLAFLISEKIPTVLRCPLAPDVNASEEHLRTLAALLREAPSLKVSLLPYHDMGRDKWREIGLQQPSFETRVPGKETTDGWHTALLDEGVSPERMLNQDCSAYLR